jgi:protein SCO1/2
LYGGVLALVLGLAACQAERPQFQSVDITGADYASQLDLPDDSGQLRHLTDFKGKVVAVFFGYTQCPDVCPTTLAELAEVKRALGPEGKRLQVLFVSLDPERDTPEVLRAYMAGFGANEADSGLLALRPASAEQLAAVTKAFKIYYRKVDGKSPGSYTLDHTAGTYLFDPQGHVRLFSRYSSGAKALLEDVQLLLNGR